MQVLFDREESNRGFTLVELAIVLVIIGLLVSAVLVGRELVETATINSQIKQITGFNTAVKTFQSKYNCLPGDCRFASRYNVGANGNGDDLILGHGLNTQWSQDEGESYNFWYHLYSAGLSDFQGVNSFSGAYTQTMMEQSQPQGKLPLTYLIATGFSNYGLTGWKTANSGYLLSGLSTLIGQATFNPGLKPQQAYSIDTKMDDGMPFSGKIIQGAEGLRAGACMQSYCNYTSGSCATASAYNVSLNSLVCTLAFTDQFY